MKVIFLEDVPGTADAGEVREVKNGFARNHLLPKQLAAPATPGQLQRMNAIQKAAEEKRHKITKDMAKVAESMDGINVSIEIKAGPTGRLFGSVTSRHIAEAVKRETGHELDHRSVLLGESIHELGNYPVNIRLYREVVTQVNVAVVPEGGPDAAIDQTESTAEMENDGASDIDLNTESSEPDEAQEEIEPAPDPIEDDQEEPDKS